MIFFEKGREITGKEKSLVFLGVFWVVGGRCLGFGGVWTVCFGRFRDFVINCRGFRVVVVRGACIRDFVEEGFLKLGVR